MGFSAMLAEEYILIAYRLSATSWCHLSSQQQSRFIWLQHFYLSLVTGADVTRNISTAESPTVFGLIDFSYATLMHKADFIQNEIKFKEFTLKKGKKFLITTDLTDKPSAEKEYGFFGRIKALFFKGTPNGDLFETQETFYGGLKFIRQIRHYYEFALPNPIQDNADFTGTNGAPIMDTDGNLVSLITHGYEGATKIYGIALSDFKLGIDAILLTDENNNR
jgi:hypothetical protein